MQTLHLPPHPPSLTVCRLPKESVHGPCPDLYNSHVLGDRGIADSVGSGWDAGFTAVAASAAVQTGHVHSVKAVMCLPRPWGCLLFSILVRASAGRDSRGSASLAWGMDARQGYGLVIFVL